MGFFGKRLAGAGYVVLNVIRVMNIISLLAVMAASTVMLVKIINNNSFFFFDAVEHVIRVVICGFLVLTELPFFKNYFSKNWPLLSHNSGFVMLGAAMLLVGNSVLANLNKDAASEDNLGLAFWRLVIGSGIVIIVMGAVNIVASYIFRDAHMNMTARHVRSNGATASQKLENESSIAASTPKTSRRSRYRSLFLPNKHRNSLPSYTSQTYNEDGTIATSNPPMSHNQSGKQPENNNNNNGSSYSSIRSPYGMGSPGKSDPFTTNRALYPASPSSKYSVDAPGINKPNMAHHPALAGRNNNMF